MPTSYGNWEISYTEGEPAGLLFLHVCPDEDDTPEVPVSCIGIPPALVAELGACLALPPTQWPLREGWMDHYTLFTIQEGLKGLEPPI